MKEKIDSLLSEFPSYYVNNKAAADELFAVAVHYNLRVNKGCKDCIMRCYRALQRIQQNNYNMDIGEKYLFRKDLHSYRMPNTAKALTNTNSTEEERKAVYESSEARKTLFDSTTIPSSTTKKAETSSSKSTKSTSTKKRVSTKKED